MDKVSASQPRDFGFEPYKPTRVTTTIHHNYDTSTGWLQEADLRGINISC